MLWATYNYLPHQNLFGYGCVDVLWAIYFYYVNSPINSIHTTVDVCITLKGYSTFFWKYAHFTTPPELNC